MLNKDDVLERFETQHVLKLMEEEGEYPFKTESEKGQIWFKTICHTGDLTKKSNKLCYFEESKTFFCYTECGSMSIFNFVMQVRGVEFSSAVEFIGELVGMNQRVGLGITSNRNNHKEINSEMNIINKYTKMRNKKPSPPLTVLKGIKNPNILDYFEKDVFYEGWLNEGIGFKTMIDFNILWYESQKAVIIPHFNQKGKIVGIRRRSLLEENVKSKYMPLILEGQMYEHPLNSNLYGLYEHIQTIKRLRKVVIVESEKSVLLAHEYYGENTFVIATCGFNISKWHIRTLLSLGVEEIIIGFDKDFDITSFEDADAKSAVFKQFLSYKKRIISLAQKLTPYFRTFVLWDEYKKLDVKDSPFDKGQEVLEFLMKNKVEMTTEIEGYEEPKKQTNKRRI